MKSDILVGPLLGLESNDIYTVSLLTRESVSFVDVLFGGQKISAVNAGSTLSGTFWRAEIKVTVEAEDRKLEYQLELDAEIAADQNELELWTVHIPGTKNPPRLAYTSCNGFSEAGLREKTSNPYHLWNEMVSQHKDNPFSLLLMGGDQLYADEIWHAVPELSKWSDLPKDEKIKRKASKVMEQQIDSFYDKLYQKRWSNSSMSLIYASVPSVMMWDDHDIFDGWGSHPKELSNCDVYLCIFKYAKKYFELYQIRTKANKSLINSAAQHYAFSFEFRKYHILAIDNRAERTLKEVMSSQQWLDVNNELKNINNSRDLLLLSAVPIVYRDFSFTETAFDITPWEEELTDDLKDHWRAKEHQGERARLIMNLLENAKRRKARTVILSGDVHIGCLGVINDCRLDNPVKIHQVVSSGIVHPSPSLIAWYGIMAVTNDNDEYLNEDNTIKVSMLKPHGSDKYIRSRNFVTMEEGSDSKLWINWICEGKDCPVYPLA